MTLKNLLSGGNIVTQPTSKAEIQELLRVAARSLKDARVERLSPEGRFSLGYDGVLQLATIVLRCNDYRTRGEGHHWAVFDVLPELMDVDVTQLAAYFQSCRSKRSSAMYHRYSVVTKAEVVELLNSAYEFERLVRDWLKRLFPQYS